MQHIHKKLTDKQKTQRHLVDLLSGDPHAQMTYCRCDAEKLDNITSNPAYVTCRACLQHLRQHKVRAILARAHKAWAIDHHVFGRKVTMYTNHISRSTFKAQTRKRNARLVPRGAELI